MALTSEVLREVSRIAEGEGLSFRFSGRATKPEELPPGSTMSCTWKR